MDLKVRGLKSRCWQGWFFPEMLSEEVLPRLSPGFRWLPAILVAAALQLCLHGHMVFSLRVSGSKCPSSYKVPF